MKISILNENTALNDEISSLRGQLMDNNEILMQQKETEQGFLFNHFAFCNYFCLRN